MFKTWLQCLSLPVGRLQKNEKERWLVPITLLLLLFSHWVVSNSLWPYGLQHDRVPCPSPSPKVCSNSCPLSQWCYPTISSSVFPLFCLQSFPASESFCKESTFASSGQSIRASVSALPNYLGLISFRMDWFDLLVVQGILKSLLRHYSSKASILPHP